MVTKPKASEPVSTGPADPTAQPAQPAPTPATAPVPAPAPAVVPTPAATSVPVREEGSVSTGYIFASIWKMEYYNFSC